ncbi:MAG: YidC/Oxa1 family membrane protein insertase [Clostridia bacterium]|nr:YidC/Oxa1 family membrane protein insertase [Clostridia bacterium]
MNLNLLSTIPLTITGFAMPTMGWLAKAIGYIITAFGSIGIGVIIFTIALKLITFPLDFISRSKMRKNSLKMEQMRPQLEKLQKQYANDKMLYQQKMTALYKKEGYSMVGACLPTIVTLVIFIVVLSGFQNYSKFQNKEYLYHMSNSFDAVVYEGISTDGEYLKMEDGKLVIDYNGLYEIYNSNNSGDANNITVNQTDKTLTIKASDTEDITVKYDDNLITYSSTTGYVTVKQTIGADGKISEVLTYFANEPNLRNNEELKVDGKTFAILNSENAEITAEKFIELVGQEASANTFREENQGFIWVKNIWQPDSAMAHPVSKDYAEFKKLYGDGKTDQDFTENYTLLTAKLDVEKGQANGYFILVVLNVLTSFLLQFISSRAQKAQMELQSVDGQGKNTQKMMMWMMPLMMGFFAIYYTAAFSLYIVISSLYSICSTLLINKLVDIKFAKDVKKQANSKDKRYRKQGE